MTRYEQGFIKRAEELGYDGRKLLKLAYMPMYATTHQVGSLKDNMNAVKNWAQGNGPAMQTAFAVGVNNDDLSLDQSSISAPTLVDRIHGWWNGINGGWNPYGHENMGQKITPQQFDANIQAAKMDLPKGTEYRAPDPGEYDGSWTQDGNGFRKGNTTSYPINGAALAERMRREQDAYNGSESTRTPVSK